MSGVLESEGLTVRYAGNVALSAIDISVPAGTMVGLVGANGAGKSTLGNAVAGWARGAGGDTPRGLGVGLAWPAAGAREGETVQLGGSDISGLAAHQRVAQGL